MKPEDDDAFIAVGAVSATKAIPRPLCGIWYIAHRCYYAETVSAKVDARRVNFESAHKRTIAMTISRLRAYGGRWRRWVAAGQGQYVTRGIAVKHQDKGLLFHTGDGEYTIHQALWDEAERLGIKK